METRTRPRFRRWRTAALLVVGAVALWGAVGGLLVPPLARHLIAKNLSEQLGRDVVVDRVSVNPFTLKATVEGLRILEADKAATFVSFDRLDLDASAETFWRFAPIVDQLALTGLKVNLVRDSPTHYNLSDIITRLQAAAARAPGKPDDDLDRFSISNIRVVNASVDFDDRPVGRKHRVSDIQLSLPFVSTRPRYLKEYIQPSFAANVNGSPLRVAGETMPFEEALRTHFTLDISAVDLRRYLEYSPVPLPVKVESATLDAHIKVRFTQSANKGPAIDVAGTAGLGDVVLSDAGGPVAKLARLELDLASFDPIAGKARVSAVRLQDAAAPGQVQVSQVGASDIDLDTAKRTLHVAAVTTSGGQVDLKRGRDGSIEMPRFAPASSPRPAAPAAPSDAPAWKFALDRFSLSGFQVALADAAVKPAMTHRIALQSVEATGVSNDQGGSGKAVAKLGLDRGGSLDVDATFALEPLRVTAKLDARNVDLVALRHYIAQFPMVQLKSGVASASGTLVVKGTPEAPQLAYNGLAELSRFATFDTSSNEDLLNFRSVRASGVDFAWAPEAPLALAVAEIRVDRIYSRMVLNPDGKLNVQQLRAGSAGAAEGPEPRPRNVRIERITFVDGRLNFTDHYIRPNYSADVGELQGAVTGLSSDPASRAKVELKGRYDATSPVTIAGTVNPLAGELFLDIAAKGTDIELPKLTAYSQRYAGYGITEGRLSLDVKYHIENGKLEGRNRILIERLTFGDKVESPEATTLPVLFAVNLLKDEKGEIALELPISGSLSDPQFAVSALIGQVLGNLLRKAVTAPFSLLAAAFGGSGGTAGPGAPGVAGDSGKPGGADDLAFVDFEAGRADLDGTDQRKLETMARALKGRPGLTLSLAPLVDAEADLRALRFASLQRAVAGEGKAIDDAAYPAAVRSAYARAKLPGDPQVLSVAAMEMGLMERAAVGEAELAALSQQRVDGVRAYLVDKGQLAAKRIVTEQPVAEGAAADSARGGRVRFALR